VTVRVFNPSAAPARLRLTLPGGLRAAAMVNLLEEAEHDLALGDDGAAVEVSAFGLRTVQLIPRQVPLRHEPR
jgi:hypothetical protein